MRFLVDNQKITVTDPLFLVSETVGVYNVIFEFTPEWDEYVKTAVFKSGDDCYEILLNSTNECYIPYEILSGSGYFSVGVYGIAPDKVYPTVWSAEYFIRPGTTEGREPVPPTPSVYQQIMEELSQKQDKIDNIDHVLEVVDDSEDHIQNSSIHVTRTEKSSWNNKQNVILDLSEIRENARTGATAYHKPTTGIPKTDLATAVRSSLNKADSALQEHQSLSNYYTKAQTLSAINSHHDPLKANIGDSYTKAEADERFFGTEVLEDYYTKEESDERFFGVEVLDDYYDKEEADERFLTAEELFTEVYSKAQTNDAIANHHDSTKANATDVYTKVQADGRFLREHQSLSNYYTKAQTNSAIAGHHDDTKANTSDVYTKVQADGRFLKEHQSLSNYYTKSESDSAYSTKVNTGYYIGLDLNDDTNELTAQLFDIFGTLLTESDPVEIRGGGGGTDISDLIPAQASPQNKLADKAFVNSSIGTNTAYYISDDGEPFSSLEDLEAYSGTVTNNDYAFVMGTDAYGNDYFDRYKATVSGATVSWAREYRLNNSSFTAEQWSAISSGITSTLVAKINTAIQPTDYASSSVGGVVKTGKGFKLANDGSAQADVYSAEQYPSIDNSTFVSKGTLENALSSKGYLTEHQSLSGYATEDWVEDKGYLTEHQSLTGYATEDWVEDQGYLTEHQSLNDYVKEDDLAPIAFSGDYNQLSNVPDDLIYYCTYGSTTFNDISSAVANGQLPVCLYNDTMYVYTGLSNGYHCFAAYVNPNFRRLYTKTSWNSASITLQNITSSDVSNWNGKQNALTPGDNISIVGDVISAAFGEIETSNGWDYIKLDSGFCVQWSVQRCNDNANVNSTWGTGLICSQWMTLPNPTYPVPFISQPFANVRYIGGDRDYNSDGWAIFDPCVYSGASPDADTLLTTTPNFQIITGGQTAKVIGHPAIAVVAIGKWK